MKDRNFTQTAARRGLSVACLLLMILFPSGGPAFAQEPPAAPPTQLPAQPLTPEQLETLVAPVALYPDPLLSQVLAASTYPLEVVEAQQCLQQNGNLRGAQLMDAARQQNWDASVQALVAFPEALTLLNRDIRWTTDLGNAWLAQQNDVMNAIQRLRFSAQQNGRLASTPQQIVNTETENGQRAVVIEPATPEVIYVPVYNPVYVWGPPAWGYYPPLLYPGIGFGFGPGVFVAGFFPSWAGAGWGGWGAGWGWGCGWFGGGIYVNHYFFSHYGFRGFDAGAHFADGGRGLWQHDPFHRAGVPYPNAAVAARFNNARYAAGRVNRSTMAVARSYTGSPARGFHNAGSGFARGVAPANRAGVPNVNRGNFGSGRNLTAGRNYSAQTYRGNPGRVSGGASRSSVAPRITRAAGPNRGGSGEASRFIVRTSGGGRPAGGGGHPARSGHPAGGGHPGGGGHPAGGGHPGGGGHPAGGGGHPGGGRK